MKSLGILMREKGLRRAVRTSEENFGRIADGAICVLPLYFIGELDRLGKLHTDSIDLFLASRMQAATAPFFGCQPNLIMEQPFRHPGNNRF